MVDYIYTGSTDLVEGYAEDVLAIADKYAILPLKEQCERYLSTTINCKNVASTAVFADTYSASILKQVRDHIFTLFFINIIHNLFVMPQPMPLMHYMLKHCGVVDFYLRYLCDMGLDKFLFISLWYGLVDVGICTFFRAFAVSTQFLKIYYSCCYKFRHVRGT